MKLNSTDHISFVEIIYRIYEQFSLNISDAYLQHLVWFTVVLGSAASMQVLLTIFSILVPTESVLLAYTHGSLTLSFGTVITDKLLSKI
jgi:hypothetical protein